MGRGLSLVPSISGRRRRFGFRFVGAVQSRSLDHSGRRRRRRQDLFQCEYSRRFKPRPSLQPAMSASERNDKCIANSYPRLAWRTSLPVSSRPVHAVEEHGGMGDCRGLADQSVDCSRLLGVSFESRTPAKESAQEPEVRETHARLSDQAEPAHRGLAERIEYTYGSRTISKRVSCGLPHSELVGYLEIVHGLTRSSPVRSTDIRPRLTIRAWSMKA